MLRCHKSQIAGKPEDGKVWLSDFPAFWPSHLQNSFLCSSLIIILLLLAFPHIPLAGTFSDNFDDGDLVGWKSNAAVGVSIVQQKLSISQEGSSFL